MYLKKIFNMIILDFLLFYITYDMIAIKKQINFIYYLTLLQS